VREGGLLLLWYMRGRCTSVCLIGEMKPKSEISRSEASDQQVYQVANLPEHNAMQRNVMSKHVRHNCKAFDQLVDHTSSWLSSPVAPFSPGFSKQPTFHPQNRIFQVFRGHEAIIGAQSSIGWSIETKTIRTHLVRCATSRSPDAFFTFTSRFWSLEVCTASWGPPPYNQSVCFLLIVQTLYSAP